jgi:hypothetical protein
MYPTPALTDTISAERRRAAEHRQRVREARRSPDDAAPQRAPVRRALRVLLGSC